MRGSRGSSHRDALLAAQLTAKEKEGGREGGRESVFEKRYRVEGKSCYSAAAAAAGAAAREKRAHTKERKKSLLLRRLHSALLHTAFGPSLFASHPVPPVEA